MASTSTTTMLRHPPLSPPHLLEAPGSILGFDLPAIDGRPSSSSFPTHTPFIGLFVTTIIKGMRMDLEDTD
jgi:hypothetical protein